VNLFVEERLQPFELAEGFTVWGAAHRSPANTDGFLDQFRVNRGGINIALFHGAERTGLPLEDGKKQPHAPFYADQIPEAGLNHAFCGHYHRPRDEPHYTYPGNPDPLTFGETGERGLVIASITADGSVQRKRLHVAQSVVHDVAVEVTGCSNHQAVRDLVRERLGGLEGCARVRLDGELAPTLSLDITSLADAAPWLDAVRVVVGNVHVDFDLETIAAEPTVRGQFVRDVQAAADLDDAERRRVILTGLRALGGRTDLEVI
jgi:DNA repair exonuclease SbcCD nuclease subunit